MIGNILLQNSEQYSTIFFLKRIWKNMFLSIEAKVQLCHSFFAVNIIPC